jgi:hypothetical protein
MKAMERLTGSFTVMNWEEHPYEDATGLPMLAHATVTHELTGDIDGEASITYLLAYDSNPGTGASYVGLARITGRIGDRHGTFVARDVGVFAGGIAKSCWTILPGLATGSLCGLRGEGHFATTDSGASYSFDYELD